MDNTLSPLFIDYHQITMAYAYWKTGKSDDIATFELSIRKNPFNGEHTIFAGLTDLLNFLENYKFNNEIIQKLTLIFKPDDAEQFFDYLKSINFSQIIIKAIPEGRIVFPNEPLLSITGPLILLQLLETPILNYCNYASMVATYASRMYLAVNNNNIKLIEFGLSSYGLNGALLASKYGYIGGFTSTSNTLASITHNIPCIETYEHSFITSFTDIEKVKNLKLKNVKLLDLVLQYKSENNWNDTNINELASFIAYAYSFPDKFLALIDTYNTLQSGLLNFLAVALALYELGYNPVGIRLDSGDLAYLSKECRKLFINIATKYNNPEIIQLQIVVNNDIDEDVLRTLNLQEHEIDVFCIKTNLLTYTKQAELNMIYKMVSISNEPTIKLNNNLSKIIIPYEKNLFRLYDSSNIPLIDVMILKTDPKPEKNKQYLCRHLFEEHKRANVTASKVECLLQEVWNNKRLYFEDLTCAKKRCMSDLNLMRSDYLRKLNPAVYKISVSQNLYDNVHILWQKELIINLLS